MYLSNGLGLLRRDFVDEGLDGCEELGVEGGDEIVVVLLLPCFRERVPWQVVYVPCVLHLYVGKPQLDRPIRFGKERDVKVGAKRNGSSDGGLHSVSHIEKTLRACCVPFRVLRRVHRTQ